MMRTHLAGLALFVAITSTAACAPETSEIEAKGSTASTLGAEVVTPRAAGGYKTYARAASHAAPAKHHAPGFKKAPASTSGTKKSATLHPKANGGALPPSVDISQNVPPIADQGDTAACVTFALGYNTMGWWAAQTGMTGAPFAPMYLYSQLVQGDCAQPTFFEDALDILTQQGIASASSYQPMQQNLDCATQPFRRAVAGAGAHRVTDFTDLDMANPEQSIKEALATGVPVVIGMEMFSAIENANADNFLIDVPERGEVSSGGHAVAIFAYDDVGAWFANSWGTSWGVDGWAQLSWDFINGVHDGTPNLNGAVAVTAVSQ